MCKPLASMYQTQHTVINSQNFKIQNCSQITALALHPGVRFHFGHDQNPQLKNLIMRGVHKVCGIEKHPCYICELAKAPKKFVSEFLHENEASKAALQQSVAVFPTSRPEQSRTCHPALYTAKPCTTIQHNDGVTRLLTLASSGRPCFRRPVQRPEV